MKRLLAVVLILALALPVCAKKHQSEEIITPQTQLEKRKYQTRTYKAKDQIAVLKSILNVLQDDGYIVYNVNSLLGFIYAVKDFDTTDPNIDISKELQEFSELYKTMPNWVEICRQREEASKRG